MTSSVKCWAAKPYYKLVISGACSQGVAFMLCYTLLSHPHTSCEDEVRNCQIRFAQDAAILFVFRIKKLADPSALIEEMAEYRIWYETQHDLTLFKPQH